MADDKKPQRPEKIALGDTLAVELLVRVQAPLYGSRKNSIHPGVVTTDAFWERYMRPTLDRLAMSDPDLRLEAVVSVRKAGSRVEQRGKRGGQKR